MQYIISAVLNYITRVKYRQIFQRYGVCYCFLFKSLYNGTLREKIRKAKNKLFIIIIIPANYYDSVHVLKFINRKALEWQILDYILIALERLDLPEYCRPLLYL